MSNQALDTRARIIVERCFGGPHLCGYGTAAAWSASKFRQKNPRSSTCGAARNSRASAMIGTELTSVRPSLQRPRQCWRGQPAGVAALVEYPRDFAAPGGEPFRRQHRPAAGFCQALQIERIFLAASCSHD